MTEKPPPSWAAFQNDFDAMTDDLIDAETRRAEEVVAEEEAWLEAVTAWRAAGSPRTGDEAVDPPGAPAP